MAERLAGIVGPGVESGDRAADYAVLLVVMVNGYRIVGDLLFVGLGMSCPAHPQSISLNLSLS